ncbi:hypothetical protein [Chryseobacterium indoltheticum]|uniref:hypothetical protein n=1 Tax=Chryseobacterium indoltheticum TaxID=254 RepID=UPI003F49ACF5
MLSFKYQHEELILRDSQKPLNIEDFNAAQKDTIEIASTIKFKGAESKLIYKNEFLPNIITLPQVEVRVFFDTGESWMLVRDSSTLEHEQIHFNIHEIFARENEKINRQLILFEYTLNRYLYKI